MVFSGMALRREKQASVGASCETYAVFSAVFELWYNAECRTIVLGLVWPTVSAGKVKWLA